MVSFLCVPLIVTVVAAALVEAMASKRASASFIINSPKRWLREHAFADACSCGR
jgi:hypothetical protein